jgi:hypothetical protein
MRPQYKGGNGEKENHDFIGLTLRMLGMLNSHGKAEEMRKTKVQEFKASSLPLRSHITSKAVRRLTVQ